MKYPTLAEVEKADREQLARWYRFLPSPTNNGEVRVISRICARFVEQGNFTSELSKKIGWNE